MTWCLIPSTYSQAQAEDCLQTNYSDIESLAQSKSKHIPEKFCLPGNLTEAYLDSLFGMMSPHSEPITHTAPTTSNGLEPCQISASVGVSLAKTLAQQEKAQESQAKEAGYGASSLELLARLCPDTSLWKIPQCSLFEDLEQFLETWPRWGTLRNGACYQRETLADAICVIGAGYSLPTPTCSDNYTQNLKSSQQKPGSMHSVTLPQALRLMLPTTGANEYKGSGKDRYINSTHFRGAKMSEGLRTCETDPIYLNPCFAEAMMGWPLEWSVLKPLATDKFQEWQQQHSSCYEKG